MTLDIEAMKKKAKLGLRVQHRNGIGFKLAEGVLALAEEVERLKSENRGHYANNENLAAAIKQYERRAVQAEAEVERMKKQVEFHGTKATEFATEVERLKAALRWIADGAEGVGPEHEAFEHEAFYACVDRAKEALTGGRG